MKIFDILGPVMIGPSSSHTAGAARIGYIAGKLLGEPPVTAEILLHGSFAATGIGHGTYTAITAGLLGMKPDDMRIPESLRFAKEAGLFVKTGTVALRGVHPNTALIRLAGSNGGRLEITASSPGGGRIAVVRLDGVETNFRGDCPTLVVHNLDSPGNAAAVTEILNRHHVNIASMQLYRNKRGGSAVMVIECDDVLPHACLPQIESLDSIIKATCIGEDTVTG